MGPSPCCCGRGGYENRFQATFRDSTRNQARALCHESMSQGVGDPSRLLTDLPSATPGRGKVRSTRGNDEPMDADLASCNPPWASAPSPSSIASR